MLTEIKLTNFKCFKEETSIPLSNFNLFTGVNGAGKSTVLQALLLMRQSIEYNLYTNELILNGSCVNLGSFNDIKNIEISLTETIVFEFVIDSDRIIYDLKRDENDTYVLYVSKITTEKYGFHQQYQNDLKLHKGIYAFNIDRKDTGIYSILYKLKFLPPEIPQEIKKKSKVEFIREVDLDLENIHFISADRIGPKEFYQKSNLPKFIHVGKDGEFAVNLLNQLPQELVDETLCLGNDAKTLLTQTEAWMSKVLDTDIKLKITPLRVNILELLINDLKPSNVGFGYSSILPIIVTGLIAKPGEKIIIENPEIHLHPKAQSALIEFLAKVSKTGVQVFIETHSDHILNAVRIAVLQQKLTPEETNILYFENNHKKFVHKIPIQEDGRIEEWPEGFFDQMNNDLSILFGV